VEPPVLLQLPPPGWSGMELNMTVPWRWSVHLGLSDDTARSTRPGDLRAAQGYWDSHSAQRILSPPEAHLIHYGVLPVEPGIAGKHRAAWARAARAPQT
jgi:hypothetical protein